VATELGVQAVEIPQKSAKFDKIVSQNKETENEQYIHLFIGFSTASLCVYKTN
jgi:hypothetical protein